MTTYDSHKEQLSHAYLDGLISHAAHNWMYYTGITDAAVQTT